jgi:hypothetical protein
VNMATQVWTLKCNGPSCASREQLNIPSLSDTCYFARMRSVWWADLSVGCALATSSWSSMFPLATVTNPMGVTTDHGPILLRWRETDNQG